MNTQSVVIKKIHAFLLWLNYFFEYSLIFRGLRAIGNAAKTGVFVRGFLNTERDFWSGSIIMRAISFVTRGLYSGAAWLYALLARVNESSINRKIFLACKNALGNPDNFLNKSIAGCVPGRAINWFFGEAAAPVTVFSFINIKTLYMLFIVGSLMVPSHMWNNWLIFLSAAFFVVIYVVKLLVSGEKSPTVSISPALLLFVFFCAFSIPHGFGGMDSVRVFVIFFACVAHSVLASLIIKKRDMRLFFTLAAVALAFAAIYGLYLYAMGIEIRTEFTDLQANPGMARLISTLGNPNTDAQAWSMLLPFVIAAAVLVRNDTKRLILLLVIFTVLGAFALTYSRGGYVAFVAGVAIFILMAAPRLVPIAILAGILAVPFIPAGILERLFTLGQDTSSQYRFMIWGGVLRMLEDFWVQGIGMGPASFIRIYRIYAHPLAERVMHSHNLFLDIITHSGIGALLAFLAYLFGLFKRGIAAHAKTTDRTQKIYLAAGIGALTVFVVFGVGEYVWFYPRVMLVFWVVAGIVTSMSLDNPEKIAYTQAS